MRCNLDFESYEDRRGCFFLGGIVSGLFGGGGSTSVATTTNTNVNVEVNPEIGIAIDLSGVEKTLAAIGENNAALVSSIAESDREQAAIVAQGLEAQAAGLGAFAQGLTQGFQKLAEGARQNALLIGGALAIGVYFVYGRK
jgi:hypothetical protein